MNVIFEKINKDAVLPKYAHGASQDAGMDLYAVEGICLSPGDTAVVPTGLKMLIPYGTQGEVRSRSGLAMIDIVVANSPGTIDPSYRGEVKVILHNQGKGAHYVAKGDKIAQLVLMPYIMAEVIEGNVSAYLTDRGEGGFGSTGRT